MYQYQVSFGDAIKRAFSNYCCFEGRASRSEYWWFALFNFIINFVLYVLVIVFAADSQTLSIAFVLLILYGIYNLAALLPSLGLLFRRLHDAGHSGWNCLLPLLPFIGMIILLVFCCQDSEPEENIYGPVPNTIDGGEVEIM